MNARLLPLLGLLLAASCTQEPSPAPSAPAPRPPATKHFLGNRADGKLHVYFFDVGQGDSALIVSPEGRTVLVDAGPPSAVNHLLNRLPELLATRLDLVVLTHPAPDHTGALDVVQKVADPRRLLEPQLPDTSSEYDALLLAIGSRGVEIFSPAPNPAQPQELTRLPLGGGAELTVLWPRAPSEPLVPVTGGSKSALQEANSIVLRLTYGKTSVLFAGDARAETEAALLKGGAALGSTLLKVGAHGADFASTEPFLKAVGPQAAIISVGTPLSEQAPSALGRLKAAGARVFRTDQDGEVHAVSDGQQFVLTPQKLHAGEPQTTQYAFVPKEKEPDLVVLPPLPAAPTPAPAVAKPEPVKVVPAKTASSKQEPAVDLPRVGKVVNVTPPKKQEPSELYYASSKKLIFHKASCSSVKMINQENLLTFRSREEAMRKHKPANDCHPEEDSMPKATVDRFEEELAVLIIDGRQVTKPRAELPAGAREGDVIDLDTGRVDTEATEALREQVRKARRRTKKKQAPPGNFDL